MPRNVYSEIYVHVAWHTRGNVPVIEGALKDRLYHYIRNRVVQTPDVVFHEIGGVEDHVHLAVSIPPTLEISGWIGELKGASAHYINHAVARRGTLAWQKGYGVVSFGKKALPFVLDYIRNQPQRHGTGRVHGRLEAMGGE
jgi:putative transposase